MNVNDENIRRFLALSALYFRLYEKAGAGIEESELLEFLDAINDYGPPQMSPE